MAKERRRGLGRIEIALFVFGVLAFAFLMLALGDALTATYMLPVIGLWVVGGLGFIWWFDRHLARVSDANAGQNSVARLDVERRKRGRRR
jgi:hypothetical protein